LSGTSPATGHVAGAAAIYLHAHPTATPATVNNAMIALATAGKLTGIGAGSPNRLLYTPGLGCKDLLKRQYHHLEGCYRIGLLRFTFESPGTGH
jgi:hypothetical protein